MSHTPLNYLYGLCSLPRDVFRHKARGKFVMSKVKQNNEFIDVQKQQQRSKKFRYSDALKIKSGGKDIYKTT